MQRYKSIVASLFVGVGLLPLVGSAQEGDNDNTPTKDITARNSEASQSGSGSKYTTTVNRTTIGELNDEDFREASLLASRILVHLDKASDHLLDDQADKARAELGLAQSLVGIIRDLLPITQVETVVTDHGGKEVYRYLDRVQDDQIPLFKHMIAVEFIEPVLDARKDNPDFKGLRLADAEVINTSILMDLDLVERKIRRAMDQLDDPASALIEVTEAQSKGVDFIARREESPLVDAQSALRLSERMINDKRFETAEENLRLARLHLETYRQILDEEAGETVKQLQDEIENLHGKLERDGSSNLVRGFWNRVTSWFDKEPGQAEPTGGFSDEINQEEIPEESKDNS